MKHYAFCDLQLVASQFSGDYEVKNDHMDAYLRIVHNLAKEFESFVLTKILLSDNTPADSLAALASTSDPALKRTIPIESILEPSVRSTQTICVIDNDADDEAEMSDDAPTTDWRDEIRNYISDGTAPEDKWAARS